MGEIETEEYVRVEGGCIVDGPRGLPELKGEITGVCTLSRTTLATLGWLPVIDIVCAAQRQGKEACGNPFLAVRKTHVVRYCYSSRDEMALSVSRRQLFTALDLLKLRSKAEALMLHEEIDADVRAEWANARIFNRHSVMLLGLGAALGLTEKELDRLFAFAMQC